MSVANLRLSLCGLVFVCFGLTVTSHPLGGYHLLKKFDLGAAPGGKEYWDYLTFDPAIRHLYISHNTEVQVVDVDTGKIVGTIPDLKRVHGIAIVRELNRGFISDGGADEVVFFDLKTLRPTGHIKTGGNPDCIIYDPASKHIFAMNGKTNDASVIDPRSATVVATVAMGGRPEYAVADGHGTIYDNIEDKNEVVAIDSLTNTIKSHWPIAPAEEATAIDLDVKHHRLFVGGRNKVLAIIDTASGKVAQTFPIGAGVDTNIYEPSTGLLFVAARDGVLHVFHEDKSGQFSAVEDVKTQFGARNMALDRKTHHLFIDTSDFSPAPEPTTEQPHPQPVPVPGTFRLLVYGR
jgi:YVTN family beta-propeller protein